MWVFLDDFADNCGTKAFRIGRTAVCLLSLAVALVLVIAGVGKAQRQAADEADLRVTLDGLKQTVAAKTESLADLQNERAVKEYTPANTCDAVSALQSSYGNNNTNTAATVLAENAAQTMEQLKGYTMADATKTAWFNAPMERYGWRAVNSGAASAEEETPILWECVSDKGELLAVATGTYYGEEDRCGNFRIYMTQMGQNKTAAGSDGNSGALVSQMQGSAGGANIVKTDGQLPAGYNDTDRAHSGDMSWNGTAVIFSAEEDAFRVMLSSEDAVLFGNLNHAARQRYMAGKGWTGNGGSGGVVDVTGNSNTNAAKDKDMTNDEALKAILGMS